MIKTKNIEEHLLVHRIAMSIMLLVNILCVIFIPDIITAFIDNNVLATRIVISVILFGFNTFYLKAFDKAFIKRHNDKCEQEASDIIDDFRHNRIITDACYQKMSLMCKLYEKTHPKTDDNSSGA